MKQKLAALILISILLAGCQQKQPLVYNINKSPELREYESESEEESRFQESLAEAKSLAAQESAEQETEAVWQKKPLQREAVKARGIYLTAVTAGSDLRMADILSHMEGTSLNAVVVDVLSDDGKISYRMDNPDIAATGATTDTIPDIHAFLDNLKAHQLYVIARIVTFRDPYLETVHPEWMVKTTDGAVFHDNSGNAWVNPYNREAWNYKISVAEQCAADGFDEVQFDYVRFCTEAGTKAVVYPEEETGGLGKTDIITAFVQTASDRLSEENIFMSCDVFGTIIGSYVDQESVGQEYVTMAQAVDYMSPMIYPSHYSNGNFGLDVPDTHPYEAILAACQSSLKAYSLDKSGFDKAIVRPWLQGFTASYLSSYISYGPEQIRQEIQAVYDAGYDEWLIWNASNNYQWDAFR